MAKTRTNIMEYKGMDLELFFCTEILKLESLHYGYWTGKKDFSINGVKKAQETYTDTLVKLVPKNNISVLDVGCGIGDISRALAKKGFIVDSVSPDKNHGKYFKGAKKIVFHNTKYQYFNTTKKFDLVLMSESQNYFETDIGLKKTKDLLNDQGYLLISGMFKLKNDRRFEEVINNEKDYIEKAESYGFKLIKRIDITKEVMPTMEFVQLGLDEYAVPSIEMMKHFVKSTSPIKSAIMSLLFRKQIREFERIFEYYKERTHPKIFKDNVEYVRLLFQLKD